MANTTIKITQLPSIGNGLSASTILPVVNTSGTAVTEKVTVGAVANYVLTQAGNTLSPAFLSTIAYSVSNASQPNITSVGTLSVNTLKISGGIVGYYLQTDGSGNLTWAPGGGGNGAVGGINTQVQFNDAGNFSGNTGFTFNKTTGIFSSPFLAGNGNGLSNIQGANVSGFVANANVANTAFAVAGANVSGFVPNANVANTAFAVAGANVSGFVPNANVANTAFAVAAANVSGLGNIATRNLDGNASNVLHGDGTWSADTTTYGNSNVVSLLSAFGSNTITTTGNVSGGNVLTSANVIANGAIESGTGFSTGGYLSVDGNTDLHNTIVTGNLSATGNITATNLGNISAIN